MERKFQKQFPTRKLLDIVSSTRLWKIQQNAAITIQRAWRQYRLRKYPPMEKSKATQTIRTNQVAGGHGLGGMMNRMGNLLHIGHQSDQSTGSKGSKRRESIALREPNPGGGGVTQQTGSSSVSTGNHKILLFLLSHLLKTSNFVSLFLISTCSTSTFVSSFSHVHHPSPDILLVCLTFLR